MQLARNTDGGLGDKPPLAKQFLSFFRKNSYFNAIRIKFFTSLEPFERNIVSRTFKELHKLLRFEGQLKN